MADTQPEPDIDPKLLEILVCPRTRGRLIYERDKKELISLDARLAYPIREGVPIMLVDEARELSDDELLAHRKPDVRR